MTALRLGIGASTVDECIRLIGEFSLAVNGSQSIDISAGVSEAWH